MRKSMLPILLLILLTISLFSTNVRMMPITLAQDIHDIAVSSVAPSVTSARVGNLVNISVIVENQGTVTENFTVAVYYDTTTLETKPVTNLQPDLSTNLVFTWNTTDLREAIYAIPDKEKSYTIKAMATAVPGETETQNNQLTNSTHPVRILMRYISVLPQRTVDTSITPGMNYTVSIYTDYNGTDIWSWQFSLSYNPLLLEGIEVRNGDLITTMKHENATFQAGKFDNTVGRLSLTVAYIAYETLPVPTTSGPGTLAHLIFKVKDTGESTIALIETETRLFGPNAAEIINDYRPSFDHILHGYFSNTEIQVIHDIAVISIAPSPTSVTIGELVNINVTVENKGTVAENFDVRLYSDYNPPLTTDIIGAPQTVSDLAVNADKTLSFTWNTTNVKEKSYRLTAVVPEIPGETDKTNNILQSDEMVTVKAREVQPLPITEIIIGIVVVIAAITVIAILRRRRKQPLPE